MTVFAFSNLHRCKFMIIVSCFLIMTIYYKASLHSRTRDNSNRSSRRLFSSCRNAKTMSAIFLKAGGLLLILLSKIRDLHSQTAVECRQVLSESDRSRLKKANRDYGPAKLRFFLSWPNNTKLAGSGNALKPNSQTNSAISGP